MRCRERAAPALAGSPKALPHQWRVTSVVSEGELRAARPPRTASSETWVERRYKEREVARKLSAGIYFDLNLEFHRKAFPHVGACKSLLRFGAARDEE